MPAGEAQFLVPFIVPLAMRLHATSGLTCANVSEAMVEVSKQKMTGEGWRNAEVKVAEAQDTQLPTFNLFPDDQAAMKDCFRILQPGGTLAVLTWCSGTLTFEIYQTNLTRHLTTIWVTLIQSAIASIPSDLPTPTTKDIFGLYNKNWADESRVRAQFEQAGFTDINVTTVAKQYPVPVQELAEACKISLSHITNGLCSVGAEAIIATARKP
ncbi:hypothetical protein Asppvi_000629 [Aspergillus pseudoviridinutans]|uniref:Methyltransferase type 11 domain-containing protein n=1 Tax=Aspergillus pseudoviridinutans TaxID=1517512 RepID=A0A9P3B156_9EURO|nr:uncharacterized protein Asppvi_000629 [Aspergillus pseudoviridinutans]GIJ82126.1 hypothetical protein Asppvi_000629 [Aspergillus pseudoviridinutans]